MNKELQHISIQYNKISEAFTLITFMVGEMIFDKIIDAPINVDEYTDLDKKHFRSLRSNMMLGLIDKKPAVLNIEESLLLYLIVDMVCKSFVGENNLLVKENALNVMKINEKEFAVVRKSYLHFAADLLAEMNIKLQGNDRFDAIHDQLIHWKVV